MKKIFKLFTSLILVVMLSLAFTSKINAASNFCYNLRASVGENAQSVGFNWHSDVAGTKLLLATNTIMANAVEYTPTENVYSKGKTNNQDITVFNERYVCNVNISDLTLNTKYYYQVVYEDQKSEICTFKTANTTVTTFGILCDTQASGQNFQYSDQLVKKLSEINNNINFFMIAGDIVDRGGYESEWNNFDTYMPILNHNNLQATIPGNHELYHSSLSAYVDASIYNQYYNNPKNGINERLNSSYYFKYNDTLFIMLDTMNRSDGKNYYNEQVEWFKNVVMNNQSKFIVVVSHPGCYSTGVYDGDASRMRGVWRDVFEEYGVDLAISGHEHVYARTKQIYQDEENTKQGVTYVIGGGAGSKRYTASNEDGFAKVIEGNNITPQGFYCGSIVEVKGNELTFSFYNLQGELLDQFKIQSKVTFNENFDANTFMDSVKVELDSSNKSYKNYIRWDDSAFGNMKTASIYIEHLDRTIDKYIGPGATEVYVGPGIPDKSYKYNITFTDYDNETYTKTLELNYNPEEMKPSNFKIVIDQKASNQYEITIDYDNEDPNIVETYVFFYYNDKKYTCADHKYTLTLDEKFDINKAKVGLFYSFYGKSDSLDFNAKDIDHTINLLTPKPTQPSNGGFNCNFGAYVASLIASLSIVYIIIKRK